VSVIATFTRFAAESAGHGEKAAGHAAEEPAGIAALGIDPLAILAQAGTFLVLFWVVKKFALNKIASTLEERRKTIDNGVRLGQKMEAEEAKLEEKIEAELRKARNESDKIIAETQREAGEIMKAAEEKASQKVEQMLAEAHAKISEDMEKSRQQLKKDMLVLVAEAAEVILEEKLDAKKDETLVQRALSAVGVRR
jgi:F-type H+-transporting ATPase subunit b